LPRAESTHLIPSICRSLAVSDLPLCLLAVEDAGLGEKTDQALVDLAQIVATDSCSSRQPGFAAAAFGKATDLAWPRLSPWRAVLGNFLWTCSKFDAGALSKVEVRGDRAAARLFVGWLAQLLGWQVLSTASVPVAFVQDSDHQIDLQLLPGSDNVCGLKRVTLGLAGDDRVEIAPEAKTWFKVSASLGGHAIETGAACRSLSFAEEVAAIVHSHGMDRLYDRAASWAATLLGPWPGR
jgi:glucose-6-phosphate dehydrogenase assembly protein OpcA